MTYPKRLRDRSFDSSPVSWECFSFWLVVSPPLLFSAARARRDCGGSAKPRVLFSWEQLLSMPHSPVGGDRGGNELIEVMKLLLNSRIEDIDVLRGLLAEQEIVSEVTNDPGPLGGAEFYPKLWVDDADFDRAKRVLADFQKKSPPAIPSWFCPNCGEPLEEQF